MAVPSDEPRFEMLETVREYAQEQLAEERLARRHSHAWYFAHVAETSELRGPEQQHRLELLDRERDNLRAALDHAAGLDDPELELRLSTALWRFWWLRGELVEGRARLEHAISRAIGAQPELVAQVNAAAAGIAWSWLLSSTGVANQFLSAVGLGGITRAWLGDFSTALPAVGLIGAWVLLGLCTVLLLSGMTKIDPSLYEAARIDGAGLWREFTAVTLPSIRQEIAVCVTVTVIAALASFDIVYISTQGGPGDATMVPGLEIYELAFSHRQVGLASALAVVLIVVVLACVLPIQRLARKGGAQ